MSTGMFVLKEDGSLVEMNEQRYDSESLLQKLVADYPNLLAGDQISPSSPRKWLLVTQEMAIPSIEGGSDRWSVDHLFIDQDGVPTIVEVKRSTDTRIRREVVGQMLDYAANAVAYWNVDALRAKFSETCRISASDPAEKLNLFLGETSSPVGLTPDTFWQAV